MTPRAVALLAACVLAGTAHGMDEPIAGRTLALRQGKASSRLRLVARAAVVAPLPGGSEDPTIRGASLEIGNPRTGEWARLAAPASGWSVNALGTVFRFHATARGGTPGIRLLVIHHARRLEVKASNVGITLDEPTQGALAASLTTGTRRYCLLFGGDVRRDEPGKFAAHDAPAPAACVGPPEGSSAGTTTTSSVPLPGAPPTTSTTRALTPSSTSSTLLRGTTTTRPASSVTSSSSTSTSTTSSSTSSSTQATTSPSSTTTTTHPGHKKPKD